MEAAQHQTQNHGSSFGGFRFYSNLIMVPSILKPLTILFFIFLFQQLSGGYVVIFYAIQVFRIAGGNFEKDFDEYDTLVFLGLIRCVFFLIHQHMLLILDSIYPFNLCYTLHYLLNYRTEIPFTWEEKYTNNKLLEFLWL